LGRSQADPAMSPVPEKRHPVKEGKKPPPSLSTTLIGRGTGLRALTREEPLFEDRGEGGSLHVRRGYIINRGEGGSHGEKGPRSADRQPEGGGR